MAGFLQFRGRSTTAQRLLPPDSCWVQTSVSGSIASLAGFITLTAKTKDAIARVVEPSRGQALIEHLRSSLESSANVSKVLTTLRRKGSLSHPEDVRVAILCLGDEGFWQEGLQLLHAKLRAPYTRTPRMYSAAATILDADQWALVFELLKDARQEGALDVQVLNSAMATLNKANLPELATSIFHSADELEVEMNTCSFNTAIQSQSLAGNWPKAVGLLKAMWRELAMPDIISYNTAIWASASNGSWEVALELLREVWLEGLPVSISTFTGAILACARSGQWQRALLLLADARTQLLPPDVPSHAAAIHACSEAAKWQQSLLLLTDMAGHKTWPDLVTFNTAILSCARGQQWRWSLRLLSGMLLDQVLPDAMVEAYTCSWKWEEALAAVAELECFTGSSDAQGRSSAMGAMGICRQWQWAVHLLGDLGLQADAIAWNSCISACAAVGRWQQACYLHANALQRFGATLEGFHGALRACSVPKAWQAALGLLDDMATHRVIPSLRSLTSAISSFTSGQWRHVLALSGQLGKPDAILQTKVLSEVGRSNWPLALCLLQGDDSAELGLSATGCAEAVAVAEAANAGVEGRVWLQKAQGCLQSGIGGNWNSQEAVTASELLLEYNHFDYREQRALGRRMVQLVISQLLALKATEIEAEEEFVLPRGSRLWINLPKIRNKGAAIWKRRYLKEMASPKSKTSLELSDLVRGQHFSLGSIGTHEVLAEAGMASSDGWRQFARQTTRGVLSGVPAEVAQWPTHISLSLNWCGARQLELPATFSSFSTHSERQGLLLVLKRLRAARHATSRITPLQPRDDDHDDLWLRDQWDQRDQRGQRDQKQRHLENAKAFGVRRPKASRAPKALASRAKAATAAAGRSRSEVDALIRAEAADAEFKAQELLERLAVKMEGDARQWLQLAKETGIVQSSKLDFVRE
eukprot:s125_g1.t2